MVMMIGKLRHRIMIQSSSITKDSFGEEITNWTDFSTVWAEISPVSGKEFMALNQVNSEITTKITIRYLDGINSKMRVLYRDRTFEIISAINPEESNISLILMCKEVS